MAQLPIWGMITLNGNIPLFSNKKKTPVHAEFSDVCQKKKIKNSTKMKNEKCNVMQKYSIQLTFMAKNFSPPLQQTNIRRFWTRRNHVFLHWSWIFSIDSLLFLPKTPKTPEFVFCELTQLTMQNVLFIFYFLFFFRFFDLGKTM